MKVQHNCRFCQLANAEIPAHVVFEDDFICCFLAKKPISEGHVLIVPKKHYVELEELDKQTREHIMEVSVLISKTLKKTFKPDGISVMQNGGIFNAVDHYHMHVFCRYQGDGFGWNFPEISGDKFYSTETRDKLKEAIIEIIRR